MQICLGFGGSNTAPQIERHIAKGRDAELARQRFQLRMGGHQRIEMLSKTDIVADHLQVRLSSCLAERGPDFQCAKASRVLQSKIDIVGTLSFEVVVLRMVGK